MIKITEQLEKEKQQLLEQLNQQLMLNQELVNRHNKHTEAVLELGKESINTQKALKSCIEVIRSLITDMEAYKQEFKSQREIFEEFPAIKKQIQELPKVVMAKLVKESSDVVKLIADIKYDLETIKDDLADLKVSEDPTGKELIG